MDPATVFHDHSTVAGRINVCWNRLNWKVLTALAVMGFAFIALVAGMSVQMQRPLEQDILDVTQGNTMIEQEGTEERLAQFVPFNTGVNKTLIRKVHLKNVLLNASELTTSLKGCINLHTIILEKVWILGDFDRVFLPKLTTFFVQQKDVQPGYESIQSSVYKELNKLRNTLFFDLEENRPLNLEKDLVNLQMNISVLVGGIKILTIIRPSNKIEMNVPKCNDLLENLQGELGILSVSQCEMEVNSFPSSLQYLNAHKVTISKEGNWTQVFERVSQLKEFSVQEIPPTFQINLSDLPKTLDTLSMTQVNITVEPGWQSTSIQNISLGMFTALFSSDDDEIIITNFTQMFPKVNKVALFQISNNENVHKLIANILQTDFQVLIVGNFSRNPNSTISQDVTNKLAEIGVGLNSKDFAIMKDPITKSFKGITLDKKDYDMYRFTLLGWYRFVTFASYLERSNNSYNYTYL